MEEFFRQLLRAITVALGMAYVVAGALIVYYDGELLGLERGVRITFGILLIVYGLYRTVRAAKKTASR